MARLSTAESEVVASLSYELTTIHLDGDAFGPLLTRIRAFLELDNLLLFCPQERITGWGIERIQADCFPNPSRCVARLIEFLHHAPYRFWFFDPIHPESDQRDRVVETIELVGATAYRASPIFREVIEPLHLEAHREIRALVCDGPLLLGWIGSLHGSPIAPEQRLRLAALLPALRRRLVADRALRGRELSGSAMASVIDRIRDPAFVVGASGEILIANRLARARLDADRAETLRVLAAGLTSQASGAIERVSLRGASMPPATLIILGAEHLGDPVDARIERAAEQWRLTPRQRDVLRLIARGHSNGSIAAHLGVGERAIELHVTVLLDRAQSPSRAGLMAVLMSTM